VLVPKIVTTLRGYDRTQFLADLGAGVIVRIVALPLAIAFAIASGVVEVYEINGPCYFGAAEKFKETMTEIHLCPES
jgi:MFS superfamily sulfate permease-like transporter